MLWIALLDLALVALLVALLLRLRRRETVLDASAERLQGLRHRLDTLVRRVGDEPRAPEPPTPRRPGRHRPIKPEPRTASAPPSVRLP